MNVSGMHVPDPDNVELTVTLTAKLSEWKAVKIAMDTSYESLAFREAINDLISYAEKHFYQGIG